MKINKTLNWNYNDKKTQVKQKSSLVARRPWLVILVILFFITLLRSQPAGSRPAFAKNRLIQENLTVTFTKAGRVPPTGLAGIIISSPGADGLAQPDAVSHQPENNWLDELIERIWTVESDRRLAPPDGDGGRAIGPLQIHQCVLDDVNRKFGMRFTCADLHDIEKAKIVARMYIEMWMERHREEIAARIFKGGPRGWNSETTDEYWKKIRITEIRS